MSKRPPEEAERTLDEHFENSDQKRIDVPADFNGHVPGRTPPLSHRLRRRLGGCGGCGSRVPGTPRSASAKPARPSYFASVLSGLICGLIFFVFCAVFSSMIFGSNKLLTSAIPLGIGLQTLCVLIGSFAFARFSGCKAVMAGPDINPTVFMAEASALIANFNGVEDETRAVVTVLVSMVLASLLIAFAFTALGAFKLTGIVGFIPANVVGGFLSCIGWKVLKSSFEVACPISEYKKFKSYNIKYYFGSWEQSWMYYLPALGIGLALYFLKRWHIGKPTINFPLFILGPAALFYVIIYASGKDVDEMRDAGWFYPEAAQTDFWAGWKELYAGLFGGKVHWDAMPQCIPVWIVMLLIICLDNMLKLASTEKVLGIDFDYNYEMKVGGFSSIATALLGGNSVYGQTKFNVINYSITHSTDTVLPTLVCGGFCGILFFTGAPLINFLPRFLLAGLLVFAAAGFFVENLWDARKTFNRLEFVAIWLIFLVNLVASEVLPQFGLLIAIAVGLVWAAFAFAIHFARKSNQYDKNDVSISGANHCSTAVRSATQEMKLGIIGVWYHIFKMGDTSGYIFFGTASRLYDLFKEHVAESDKGPISQRTKYAILDMTEIYGIDATAASIFSKMQRLSLKEGIELMWAGLEENVANRLCSSGISLTDDAVHATFDAAEKSVEDLLLAHVHKLAQHWLIDKTARHIYNKAMLHDALTSTHDVFDGRSLTHSICPSQLLGWADKVMVQKGEPVFTAGEVNNGLYLLYRGQVSIEEENEATSTIYPGAFFNEHVVYAHPESLSPSSAIAIKDSVMLRMSKEQRDEMHWHDPHAAFELVVAIFKQVEMRSPLRRHLHRANHLQQAGLTTFVGTAVDGDALSNLRATGTKQSQPMTSLHTMHRANRSAAMSELSAKDHSLRKVLHQALSNAQHSLHLSLREHSHSMGHSRHGKSEHRELMDGGTLSDPMPTPPTVTRGPSAESGDGSPCHSIRTAGSVHGGSSVHSRRPPRASTTPLHDTTIDADFIHGNDYRVGLPEAMAAHYKHIYELNDHAGRGHLKVDELSKFMSLSAHGLSVEELEEMMHEVGIDEDKDECISEADFLEFIRRTLLADLPSSKVPRIERVFKELALEGDERATIAGAQEAVRRRRPVKTVGNGLQTLSQTVGSSHSTAGDDATEPPGITKRQLEVLFARLGLNPEATDMTEVFDEVDVDGDGYISFPECLAAISILKRNVMEVHDLEASFTRFRREARTLRAEPARPTGEEEEDHLVRVSDLVNCLEVSEQEAEEMMFIADMNEDATVGFTEFKQVVVNWS